MNDQTKPVAREGAPEIIYLQDGGDYAAAFPDNPEGVTWNADSPIEDDDTKYIRFDLHERAIAKRTEELVAMTAERDDCVKAFAEDSRRAVKAEAEVARLNGLVGRCAVFLRRYRNETPLGNQPHMIALPVEELLTEIDQGGNG